MHKVSYLGTTAAVNTKCYISLTLFKLYIIDITNFKSYKLSYSQFFIGKCLGKRRGASLSHFTQVPTKHQSTYLLRIMYGTANYNLSS